MSLSGKAFLAAALFAAASLAPIASFANTIDFATLSGGNLSAFTTYTEGGFTVTTSLGQFFVGQLYGNPVPDIFAGPSYGPATDAITLTMVGGGTFSLSQFDFSSNGGSTSYVLTGDLGNSQIFSISGSNPSTPGFVAIVPGTAADLVNSATLQFTGAGTSFNIDNIVLSPAAVTGPTVPEPTGIALLGTGMLGLIAVARRRLAA